MIKVKDANGGVFVDWGYKTVTNKYTVPDYFGGDNAAVFEIDWYSDNFLLVWFDMYLIVLCAEIYCLILDVYDVVFIIDICFVVC